MEATALDITVWKWVSGTCVATLLFVGRAAWNASKKVTAMETSLVDLKDKIAELKIDNKNQDQKLKEHEDRCPQLQKDLTETISKALRGTFEAMLNEVILKQTEKLGEINTSLALIAQGHKILERKVDSLSDKVDDARDHALKSGNPMDTGRRRRYSDFGNKEGEIDQSPVL